MSFEQPKPDSKKYADLIGEIEKGIIKVDIQTINFANLNIKTNIIHTYHILTTLNLFNLKLQKYYLKIATITNMRLKCYN